MDLELFLRGLAIGFIVAAPVGPVNLVCIHRTLGHGRVHGFLTGLGGAAADGLFAVMAAFGFTTVSDWLLQHDMWLKLLGGTFLVALGIRTFLTDPPDPETARDEGKNLPQAIAFTFFLTITNPVTILGFAAVFAGAGVASDARDTATAATLVAGVFSGSTLWWLSLATGVGFFHGRLEHRTLRRINLVSGAAIFVFGLVAFASLLGLRLPK
jgi:threonine/homoserine/homoserine lactone efflux protein